MTRLNITRCLGMASVVFFLVFSLSAFGQATTENVSENSSEAKPENFLALSETGGLSALTVTTNPDGSQEYTVTLQILAIMTALTFLPAIVMMMTSFTRIIIVFAILRQALGL